MKGNSEQVIESAIQNPNTAADSLATQTTKYINVTRGEQLIESSGDWIRQLKAAQTEVETFVTPTFSSMVSHILMRF